jgi:large subunit ribosomal protein L29
VKALKGSALREKTMEELLKEEQDLTTQLFKLRFQQSTGQAENPHRIRSVRRDLARVKTVITEKRRAAGAAPARG